MLKTFIRSGFGLDLRSLAFFRVGLGLMIIIDLLHRSRDLVAHYTDTGIFPRSAYFESFTFIYSPLHTLGGTPEFQAILFLVTGLFALLLILGYKTRWVTVILWLLVHSMVYRNVNIIYRGDLFLCLLTFWGMFLPLGEKFSIDAALDKTPPANDHNHYFSISSVAFTLQVGLIYFFAGIMKFGPEWQEGSAIYYTLHDEIRVTDLGRWLRQYPDIMEYLTYFVLYIEKLSPILLFLPLLHTSLRIIGLASLILMHIGFILFINIGLFPYICIVTLSALTPGRVWDRLSQFFFSENKKRIQIYFDGDCEFCKKTCLIFRTMLLLPSQITIKPAQGDKEMNALMEEHYSWIVTDHKGQHHLRWEAVVWLIKQSPIFWPLGFLLNFKIALKVGDLIYTLISTNRMPLGKVAKYALPYKSNVFSSPGKVTTVFLVILMLTITYQNINVLYTQLYRPVVIYNLHHMLGLRQGWGFFAPSPPRDSRWIIVEGITRSDKDVDVYNMTLEPVSWDTPSDMASVYKNYRWRKYLAYHMIQGVQYQTFLGPQYEHYGRYLCHEWNNKFTEEDHLKSFKIHMMRIVTQPDYETAKPVKEFLYEGPCDKGV